MNAAQIVNRIIEKLGGNRVEFVLITKLMVSFAPIVVFVHAGHAYRALHQSGVTSVLELEQYRQGEINDFTLCTKTAYSEWIEGVLNGMVRNDAGELVKQ